MAPPRPPAPAGTAGHPRTLGAFLAALPWTQAVQWHGETGYIRLDATRLARIAASPGRASIGGEWTALEVTILDVHRGRIDGVVLHFDDLADPAVPAHRADDRLAAHATAAQARFHISRSRGTYAWYVAVPAQPEVFIAAVEAYVDQFRDPEHRTLTPLAPTDRP
ncbi:MAG: hypothetical protein AB1941_00610 [Gemmatimonadota bacterium]